MNDALRHSRERIIARSTRIQASATAREIVRDDAGQPVLIRGGNQSLRKLMPRPNVTREQTMEALGKLLRRYNEVGITTIFERATDRDGVGLYA
ncbi:MAG: hypothetical protein HZC54_00395 [Verrucomicrobia bacterium]|nr:hypothetical protein [Verrucomicrobiota bacterium]